MASAATAMALLIESSQLVAYESLLRRWLTPDEDSLEAFTSGSTGMPKRICLPKSDVRASAEATCQRFGIDERSLLLLPLSLSYIAGKMMAVRSWVSGSSLMVDAPNNAHPLRLLESDREARATLVSVVPSQIEGVLSSDARQRVEWLMVGGAPMTHAQEQMLELSGMRAVVSYGMTETCSHVALRDVTTDVQSQVFEAMPGVSFASDERGCLIVESPRFTWGRLVTNDMVEMLDSKHFRLLGRYDNVINSGGLKVHPEEVERIIAAVIPDGVDYYVRGVEHPKWGEVAALVLADGCSEETHDADANLLHRLRELMPHHMVPQQIIHVSEIARTSTGKLKRK